MKNDIEVPLFFFWNTWEHLMPFHAFKNIFIFQQIQQYKNQIIFLITIKSWRFVCNLQWISLEFTFYFFVSVDAFQKKVNEIRTSYLSYWNNICYLIWTSKGRYTLRILNGKLHRFYNLNKRKKERVGRWEKVWCSW